MGEREEIPANESIDQWGCEFRLSAPICFGPTCKRGAILSHSLDEIPLLSSTTLSCKTRRAFCIECATRCELTVTISSSRWMISLSFHHNQHHLSVLLFLNIQIEINVPTRPSSPIPISLGTNNFCPFAIVVFKVGTTLKGGEMPPSSIFINFKVVTYLFVGCHDANKI